MDNLAILQKNLYGKEKYQNFVRNLFNADILNKSTTIESEKDIGIQKTLVGSVIITRQSIGQKIVNEYNERQRNHIRNFTICHKNLCERRNEPSALLFLTLHDLLENCEEDMSQSEMCKMITSNIVKMANDELFWVIKFSKYILRNYYSIYPTKFMKIKLNFMLDDNKYLDSDAGSENNAEDYNIGGLLVNGLIQRLIWYNEYYGNKFNEDFGFICQVLSPNGLPKNKKWTQIDMGISIYAKRLVGETELQCLKRELQMTYQVHSRILSDLSIAPKFIYNGNKNTVTYEGCAVYFIEVLYSDGLNLKKEKELDYSFCKCEDRDRVIKDHENTKLQAYKAISPHISYRLN